MSSATNIIEQAARRLEELKRSGVEVPPRATSRSAGLEPRAEATSARRLMPAVGPRSDEPAHFVAEEVDTPLASTSKRVRVDQSRLAAMKYVIPSAPREQVSEEFRIIKRTLLHNARGSRGSPPVERANLIMVTSALPGEGKTFVSINLAISIAMELDSTVLLVDADVSRPAVLDRLGLPQSPGLLNVLTDSSLTLPDVLMRTDIDKLSLLPAGAPHGHATEFLASDGVDRLLGEMATRYPDRIIIFDAPPLLPSTESRVLATRMGQVVLVVEADRTPQKQVMQALGAIESCPLVLPLLNKIGRSEVGSYYGYYDHAR